MTGQATPSERRASFLAGEPIDLAGSSIPSVEIERMCKTEWHQGVRRDLVVANGQLEGDLAFDNVHTDASIELLGVVLTGTLRLSRAVLNRLVLSDTKVQRIEAAGMETARGVDLSDEFTSHERVHLVGAKIHGNLEASRATFGRSMKDKEENRSALVLDAAHIEGNVNLSNITADGRVRVWRAEIGGTFTCSGTMASLIVRRTSVDQDGKLTGAVDGHVDLRDSVFAGRLYLHRAMLEDLDMRRCSVGGDLYLGHLTVLGTQLNLSGVTVAGDLVVTRIEPKTNAAPFTIRLLGLRAGRMQDQEHSWPAGSSASIEFDDITIGGSSLSVGKRIEWLRRNKRWSPQPWHEMAAMLRRSGNVREARKLAVEGEKEHTRRMKQPLRTPHIWLWRKLLHYTIGFGYRPGQALICSAIIVGVCAAMFTGADFRARSGAPDSSTLLYSLDSFMPIDLGYFGSRTPTDWWWSALASAEAASGWLLSALVVGALTGLLRKD